jgi:hypothetical protein
MFGRPKSYWYTYETGKAMYEDGQIAPDLYKITAPVKPYEGKLKFQIQEIEVEESFFKWLELRRVVHTQNTEVVVDSEYKKFYVLPRADFEKSVIAPTKVLKSGVDVSAAISDVKKIFDQDIKEAGIRFEPGESITLNFENLKEGEVPYLVVKSWFRDWVLGLEEDWQEVKYQNFASLFRLRGLSRALASLPFMLLGAWFFQKRGLSSDLLTAAAPFVIGAGSDPGSMCICSFVYEYRDEFGQFNQFAISEPRAWHYNTEIIEMPRESVLAGGRAEIRISASKRHVLGFVGISQRVKELDKRGYREEKLRLLKAEHSRLKRDVSRELTERNGDYVHTVPGDTINLEFEAPKMLLAKGEKETYLIRASGFYTSLRPESRELAGNWRERISPEARGRLASLKPLKNYS